MALISEDWMLFGVTFTPDQIGMVMLFWVLGCFLSILATWLVCNSWTSHWHNSAKHWEAAYMELYNKTEGEKEKTSKEVIAWASRRMVDPTEAPNTFKELKENTFTEAYDLDRSKYRMPDDTTLNMVICPKCNWKGQLGETIKTYGHTICPYCHEEFKELVR